MHEIEHAYQVLEILPGASLQEVNEAYKDLVFIWHPDRIPKDNLRLQKKAQEKIKALNQARDVLRTHNRSGASTVGNRSSRYGTAYSASRYSPPRSSYGATAQAQSNAYRSYYGRYRPSGYSAYDSNRSSNGSTYRPKADSSSYTANGSSDSGPTQERTRQASSHRTTSRYTSTHSSKSQANPASSQQSTYDKPRRDAETTSRSSGDKPYNAYNAHTRSGSHRSRQNPDLSGSDFKGANLREKDLSGRNLSEADLSGADLSDAFLHKVNLNRANLSRAKLFRANLLQADLSHANLREADLIGADLSGADLSGADLSGAKVSVGSKTMVKLTGTILTGAIMPDGSIHD